MHIPTILDNVDLPLQKKKRRGPKVSPLAMGIAGTSAVALVAYKKRNGRSESSEPSMAAEGSELSRHVADMVALDQEMAKSLRKQLDGEAILSIPQARPILEQSAAAYEKQAEDLESEIGSGGGGPSAVMKKFLAAAAGAVAPILGASRTEPVSRILRDDVVGLRLAAVSSSMLRTAAKAEGNEAVAVIAKDGGDSFSLLAEELEAVLPSAVEMEFEQRHDQAPDPSTVTDSAGQGAQLDPAFSPSNGSGPT